MSKNKNVKFWLALVIFSLTGQVAWVVENMYFNVFIYKIFNAKIFKKEVLQYESVSFAGSRCGQADGS